MDKDYTIVGPDGRELTITGPANATPDQLRAAAEKAFGAAPKSRGAAGVVGDLAAGAVRGAGSIGATLLWPIDKAMDAVDGNGNHTLSSLVTGVKPLTRNEQRRKDMDDALSSFGADTNSLAYGAGKLTGEIAGTAGAGGLAGNALARVAPQAVNAANALRTSGMVGGNMATRTAGGAASGALSAGLVNPEDVLTGAVVGGALPGALKVAGKAGELVGKTIRGPAQTPEAAAAIQAARAAGYVIPPTQANPTLFNRALEGFAGKITTAQNASAKNAAVTNAKAAAAVGLPADAPITLEALAGVREQAGRAYAELGNTGMVAPGKAYSDALDAIERPFKLTAGAFPQAKPSPVIGLVESLRSPAFASASAVEKIKQLRTAADDAFRTGDTDIGRAAKAAAKALEDAIEDHLKVIGETKLLDNFREARQLIAKTYSVEKALNPATGTVDARKLAQQLQKGKPLSGDLKAAAEFAGRFPKAAQTPEGMGSLPGTSPLDWLPATALSTGLGNPLMMAGVAARPMARSAALSPMVQDRLVQSAPNANALARLMGNPAANQLGYRAAPLLLGDR